jgi:hypothetical protein
MTLVSLSFSLALVRSAVAGGRTIDASSTSLSDVAAAIAAAADGDKVIIPSGMSTWTRTLSVRKAITLQGAGVGSTIIKDGVQSGSLISWHYQGTANSFARLTGIEFEDGGRVATGYAPTGVLRVVGCNTNGSAFRWDHCKWNDVNGYPVFDTVIGVIDHNSFIRTSKHFTVYIYDTKWDGRSYGDGSWAAPTGFGSSQFLFIEDNDFVNNGGFYAMTDGFNGARFVVRYNAIHNADVANHGTESPGRGRGGRAMEVYRNTLTGTNVSNVVVDVRSGGVLFHDNNITGYQANPGAMLKNFRNFYSFGPWGGADGSNAWDVNRQGAPFYAGAAASHSIGRTVTVSGSPGWTSNQWVGYTLRRTTDVANSGTIDFGEILSSTSDSITYTDNGGYTRPSMSFAAGDSLEIRKVDQAMDQPGRGGGSLVSRDSPTPPSNWNNQVTEPCYSWNNGGVNFHACLPSIRLAEHYFNDTPMPGYTEYTYPHPLVSGKPLPSPLSTATTGSSPPKHWGQKQKKTKQVKGKSGKKAKEKSADQMAGTQENHGD